MKALWLDLAKKELGVSETPGSDNNPKILKYFQEAGHPEVKTEGEAWCAAFVGSMLHRAGIKPSGSLMARSYLKWGKATTVQPGAVAVFWRGSPAASTGHVGFLISATSSEVTIIGGNQGAHGVVSIESFPRARLLGIRWPTEEQQVNPLSIVQNIISPAANAAAGLVIGKTAASANLTSIIAHAVIFALGATGFGQDGIHTLAALIGGIGTVASALGHLHLVGSTDVNTLTAFGQFMTDEAKALTEQDPA